jgi:hypothetical protein
MRFRNLFETYVVPPDFAASQLRIVRLAIRPD